MGFAFIDWYLNIYYLDVSVSIIHLNIESTNVLPEFYLFNVNMNNAFTIYLLGFEILVRFIVMGNYIISIHIDVVN